MKLYLEKPEKMIKIINWVKENEEIWEVITTPDNPRLDVSEMRQLMDLFVRDGVSELIFLMLHAQRGIPYVRCMLENMAMYLISLKWDNEQQAVIKKMRSMFNK